MHIGILAAFVGSAMFVADKSSSAAFASDDEREWFSTIYVGQWARSNLGQIPIQAARGGLGFEDSYLVSGTLSYVFVPEIDLELPLVHGSSLEFEALLGKHFGRQDHAEVAFSVLWRSRDVDLPGGGAVNFAVGEGLSWALSPPNLEGVRPDVRTHKFLNYLAFEAEFSHEALPGVAIAPRIHHRSGIFGVIAPRHTGSNFVGVGMRMTLQ